MGKILARMRGREKVENVKWNTEGKWLVGDWGLAFIITQTDFKCIVCVYELNSTCSGQGPVSSTCERGM
jgi:hypothetical protein